MHEIVRYDPSLKEQVARLQRNLWSRDTRLNTAYFEWNDEENPFIKVPAGTPRAEREPRHRNAGNVRVLLGGRVSGAPGSRSLRG